MSMSIYNIIQLYNILIIYCIYIYLDYLVRICQNDDTQTHVDISLVPFYQNRVRAPESIESEIPVHRERWIYKTHRLFGFW